MKTLDELRQSVIHKDLRTPKYKKRVVADKSKKIPRKEKHKKAVNEISRGKLRDYFDKSAMDKKASIRKSNDAWDAGDKATSRKLDDRIVKREKGRELARSAWYKNDRKEKTGRYDWPKVNRTYVNEDAPTNSTGPAVAGTGDTGQVWMTKSRQKKFANTACYEVCSDTYAKCIQGKKKYKHWKTFVGEDDVGQEIRTYARSNPDSPIIIQDEKTGAMVYLRYGKKR